MIALTSSKHPAAPASGPVASTTMQVVVFTLANELYALPVAQVREVLRLEPINSVPQAPPFVEGILSLRGRVVTVIDLASEKPVWELKLDRGIRPMTIEANPDGSTKRIFVQLSSLNGFAVIDFAQRKEVARFTLPEVAVDIEKDPGRDSAPSHGIGVAPDNKTLWVTSIPGNAVFIYSLADLALIGKVPLPVVELPDHRRIGAIPNWVTFTPDGKTLYISNAGLRSVSAIDTQSAKLIGTVEVGEVPKRINAMAKP